MLSNKQLGVYKHLKNKYGFEEFVVNYTELSDRLFMSESYLRFTLTKLSQFEMLDVVSRMHEGKMKTFMKLREV